MASVGKALIHYLQEKGVKHIFGIPGVHTIELYRGLAQSSIQHITPRHEQGAGFMADGYARASGKVGVALVITGPGLTNAITAMAQARADHIPILVISGVNSYATQGKGFGKLHELPHQSQLMGEVALASYRIDHPDRLFAALEDIFTAIAGGKLGPYHIEIPLDMASLPIKNIDFAAVTSSPSIETNQHSTIEKIATHVNKAAKPILLVGGGAKHCAKETRILSERLDAPVISTVNARGIMHAHVHLIPASPSLNSVRKALKEADCVLAIATEFGTTDYDMYETGKLAQIRSLIRIDGDEDELAYPAADIALKADAKLALMALLGHVEPKNSQQAKSWADRIKQEAWQEIGKPYQAYVQQLNDLQELFPNGYFIGDSCQIIYAGNLYYDHDRAGGWFNAATGYGALGFSIPAAIGAAFAKPDITIISLNGDGGAQFSLNEWMTAKQAGIKVIFIIWNNHGYKEIGQAMLQDDIQPVGCDVKPPDFAYLAKAYGLDYWSCDDGDKAQWQDCMHQAKHCPQSCVIEIKEEAI